MVDEIVFDNHLSERNITTEQVNTMIDKGLRLGLIESDDVTAYIDLPDLETKAVADKHRQ